MEMNDPLKRAKQILNENPIADLAHKQREWYDAYRKEGFTDEQALRFVFKLMDMGTLLNARKK